jgi:hypothetical protein
MNNEVTMFDVGHGDCLLIGDEANQHLLVDCGTSDPYSYFPVPRFIERILSFPNKCGLAISHYHWDHYSLFRWFKRPGILFSTIYLPDLPMKGTGAEAGIAIMEFLKASIFTNFSNYRILPEIFTRTRRPIVFCRKGLMINQANLHLKVFWPDLNHSILRSKKIIEKANKVRRVVEPVMDRYHISKPNRDRGDYSMGQFFRELTEEEIQYRELDEKMKEIHNSLEQVERDFGDIANIFSVAFKSSYESKSQFLFLGDLTRSVLNKISIPGTREYDCIKAAHHGTEFGRALNSKSTEFLLISRNQKRRKIKGIDDGYLSKLRYRMLLNTEYLGDCYIC